MIRRRRAKAGQSKSNKSPTNHRSSRLSHDLMENPVNQAAYWSQDTFGLDDLVAKYPLPQIVRCSNRLVPGEEQHLSVNVHLPILLCNGRTAKKLLAKHVGTDVRTSRLMESDDRIVIPNDYEGNFLRLQARTTKDLSVVKTLSDVARSNTPAFMTLSPIVSFQSGDSQAGTPTGTQDQGSTMSAFSAKVSSRASSKGTNGHSSQRLVHHPGSVFVVSGTTTGVAKAKMQSREVTLLKCSDVRGNQVYIPCDQAGDVFQVEQQVTPKGGKLSVRPSELMTANRYPALVRYVYGEQAPRLQPCSNLFTLIDTFEENTLVGCLLYPGHALLIEVPMTSSLTFQVALNRDELMALTLPRHALEVIHRRKDTFLKDLKLKVKFLHRVTPASGHAGHEYDDDMPSATVRMRQYVNEACLYL